MRLFKRSDSESSVNVRTASKSMLIFSSIFSAVSSSQAFIDKEELRLKKEKKKKAEDSAKVRNELIPDLLSHVNNTSRSCIDGKLSCEDFQNTPIEEKTFVYTVDRKYSYSIPDIIGILERKNFSIIVEEETYLGEKNEVDIVLLIRKL